MSWGGKKGSEKGHPKSSSLPCYAQVSQEQSADVLTHLAGSMQLSNKKQRPSQTSGEKEIKRAGTKAPTTLSLRPRADGARPNTSEGKQRKPHLAGTAGTSHPQHGLLG